MLNRCFASCSGGALRGMARPFGVMQCTVGGTGERGGNRRVNKPVVQVVEKSLMLKRHFSNASTAAAAHTSHFQKSLLLGGPPTTSVSIALEHAAYVLPHQGILENFIHHNPLHDLESLKFHEAIHRVHELETYMTPGERLFDLTHIDPRRRTNEAISDLCAVFLDRGAAKWTPSFRDQGFLYFFATLEGLGTARWRNHARAMAFQLLQESNFDTAACEAIIEENLEFFGVPRNEWEKCILVMLLELRGWSGMFLRMETNPSEAPTNARVRLLEFAAVQSIFYRSSIEGLAKEAGWKHQLLPFSAWIHSKDGIISHVKTVNYETVQTVSAVAFMDQNSDRRELLETEFERALLHTISSKNDKISSTGDHSHLDRPKLQLYTCFDDRECSIRRHVEELDMEGIETFGVAGFYGIAFRYQSVEGKGAILQAPEGQDPSFILVERDSSEHPGEVGKFLKRRRVAAIGSQFWESASFSPLGSIVLSTFFPLSISRLALMGYSPLTKQKVREIFNNTFMPKPHTDFDYPFSHETGAMLLARTFKCIGTHKRFARLVVSLGHGASSVNNPFFAAYNCGACCGHEGGINARVFARLANDPIVREHLRNEHDIVIPDDTYFVAGMHNTTADEIHFFDEEKIPESHAEQYEYAKAIMMHARGQNALERCHRFLLAKVSTPEEALEHVHRRSIDAAEVRPELNHATNAAVIIGRRDLTKGQFFDRRAFLPSYDPFSDDEEGSSLEGVLAPALVVCSGINLEYLFSTISVDRHGAGTKSPLNVVGNIGVQQGMNGDLRPGLPSQMTEMHTPIRALFIVDAPVARVKAVLDRRRDLLQLVRNEWVRMVIREPTTGKFFRRVKGEYLPMKDPESVAPVTFTKHRDHGMHIARREANVYRAASMGMALSCIVPIYYYGELCMNPYGPLIAVCATSLAFPVLAFSRRYLHGEFMFSRFSVLSVGLLLGFNMVATAPTLEHVLAGWSLFGFSSTFLIGSYSERPSVRNNATFAFAAYRLSDFALLTAATFSGLHAAEEGYSNYGLVASCLIVAAFFKSSQFPLTALFARSMEGPTPTSALGYAGLSAHVGVVLLASTMEFWYGFDMARYALFGVGLYTAIYGSIVSKIRSDRKGALAYATSATLGGIMMTLSFGYPNVALLMCLGHAAFRINQILCAPNAIAESLYLQAALGQSPWPRQVPDWLYRLGWVLHRIDTDIHLLHLAHRLSGKMFNLMPHSWFDTKVRLWGMTAVGVTVAGMPFTPVSDGLEHMLMHIFPTHPVLATAIMAGHFAFSVAVIRFLFAYVLSIQRFKPTGISSTDINRTIKQ